MQATGIVKVLSKSVCNGWWFSSADLLRRALGRLYRCLLMFIHPLNSFHLYSIQFQCSHKMFPTLYPARTMAPPHSTCPRLKTLLLRPFVLAPAEALKVTVGPLPSFTCSIRPSATQRHRGWAPSLRGSGSTCQKKGRREREIYNYIECTCQGQSTRIDWLVFG